MTRPFLTLSALIFLGMVAFFSTGGFASPLDITALDGRVENALTGKLFYASESACAGYDVKTISQCDGIERVQQQPLNLGFNQVPHWFLFSLSNASSRDKTVYVEVGYPLLDNVELYELDTENRLVNHRVTGDTLPFHQRPILHHNYVFPVTVSAGDRIEIRIRIETRSSLQVPIKVWNPEQFANAKFTEFLLFGVLIGAMLLLAIYNLLMSVSMRDKSYFFCATTLFFYALVQGDILGLSYAVLWPNSPQWNQVSLVVVDVLAIASLAIFAQTFLQLRKANPLTDRLLTGGAVLSVLVALSVPFVPYLHLIILTSFLVATVPAIATIKSLFLWREGLIAARYFVFAFLFFVIAVGFYIASKFGFLPRTLFSEYSIHLGALVAVVCLSLAVADQLNADKRTTDDAQKASIASLKKFEELYNSSSEGIFRLDPKGAFVSVNPAFLKILGAPNFAAMTRHFADLSSIIAHHRDGIQHKIETEEQLTNLDVQCQRVDGNPIWLSVNTRLRRGRDMSVENIEGSIIDISERKAAEDALYEALLRLNESVKAANIGLWDWELKTNCVRYSKEYKAQLGYGEDEFDNRYEEWETRVHPDDLQKSLAAVRHSIDACSAEHEDVFRIKHKDGSYRWILAHGSVITDKQGKAVRMIGAHVDITDRKRLEEELRHSQKMEAIGHLAGGIAHDFNNQLASIMGFAELLEFKLQDADLLDFVRKIIRATEHSKNLTNQLLTFSRKQSLHLEVIDVHESLDEVIAVLSRSIDKRINIFKHYTSDKSDVLGDKSLIQNAFLNLGLNARDAMPDGGSLTLTTHYKQAADITNANQKLMGNAFIQIDFKDTGCGIPQQHRSRIFEPFYTTKALGKGTGMGLASVYGAIEQLSGCIVVDSEVGAGSCFTLYLPVVERVKQEDVLVTRTRLDTSPKGKTILVVDDEALIRDLCKDFLDVMGHTGMFAGDGAEAIKLYQAHWQDIDLVVLDMMMPSMGGEEVLAALKEINASVKVIVASGYTADNTITDMLEAGVIEVLNKPFKLASLGQAINRAVPG